MVCYHEEKKIIYIHVPKTGGMTIEIILIEKFGFKNFTFPNGPYEFLNNNEGKEGFLKYILKHSEESKKIPDLDKFERFTFVRNPYDRAYSGIRYLSEKCTEDNNKFSDTILDFYEKTLKRPFYFMHFNMTQCQVLRDLDNKINMKYIGRFENFIPDLEDILFNKLGFNRINISSYHIHKTDPSLLDYDINVVKEIVNHLHKEDFEYFSYEMLPIS